MRIPTDSEWLERAESSARRRVSDSGPLDRIELLPRHASLRRYARGYFAERSEIVMLMPPPSDGGLEEVGGAAKTALPDDPFVVMQQWMASNELPVPALYAIDEEADALWLEDLGGTDFDTWVSSPGRDRVASYRQALDVLLSFQRATTGARDLPELVTARSFDRGMLRWELDHYLEWRVGNELGVTLSAAQRDAVGAEMDALVDRLVEIPLRPMHRDYQSHNIMVVDGASPRLVLLDFQDAMMGPVVYDAVALLRDSYVVLEEDELSRLVTYFSEARAQLGGLAGATASEIEQWFFLQTVQRKLKDAGRFVFIDRVKKNPAFLRYIPDSLAYVRTALARLPELGRLSAVLSELDPALA